MGLMLMMMVVVVVVMMMMMMLEDDGRKEKRKKKKKRMGVYVNIKESNTVKIVTFPLITYQNLLLHISFSFIDCR